MVIVGFPCIGKSTLARDNVNVIDLESSYFKPEGYTGKDWAKNYIKMAKELNDQGYIVFVSSHHEVRKELREQINLSDRWVIYPVLEMKDEWVRRAWERYKSTKNDKDLRAYNRIAEHFEDDIIDLMKSRPCYNVEVKINEPKYDLMAVVTE